METITLQLRQEDSADVSTNGVWRNTLAVPQTLMPGDNCVIKSVFLDTTDVIHVPTEGLDISLSGMKYLVNYNINQKFNYRVGNTKYPDGGVKDMMVYEGTPAGTNSTGDNQLYWLADGYTSDNHQPYYLMNINVIPTTKGRGGKRYGGGTLSIKYTDVSSPTEILKSTAVIDMPSFEEDRYKNHNPIPVKSQAHRAKVTQFVTIKCAQINGKPSLVIDPDQLLYQQNIASVNFTEAIGVPNQPITPASDSFEISPQIFTWNASLPGGDYTPTEIAATLTNLFVPVEYGGATSANYNHATAGATPVWSAALMNGFPTESPFLETILQNNYNLQNPGGVAELGHNQVFINASMPLKTDPTQLDPAAGTATRTFDIAAMEGDYKGDPFQPPQDRFVGTDELAMVFDTDEKKLKMSVMHFPIYTNSTTGTLLTDVNNDAKPGVQYNELDDADASINADSGLAKAYSGIAFTDMQPQNFWSNQLGFDRIGVQINPNSAISGFKDTTNTVKNCFTISGVQAGQTITEGLASIAVPVVNSSALQYGQGGGEGVPKGQPGAYAQPIFSDGVAGNGVQVTIGDTDACFASKVYNDSIQDAGYFLVDIAHSFQQPFVGSNNQGFTTEFSTTGQNTMSVVSRYYTSNNFVTDQGAGSIVYSHSGAPIKLTDIDVRVKNPDGSFVSPSILGGKNTVFLTIQRPKAIVDLTNIPPPAAPATPAKP